MAFSGNQLTRLGLSGVPRQLYGSFAGKTAAVTIAGPCWSEGEVYEPGFQAAEAYEPGFQEGEREC